MPSLNDLPDWLKPTIASRVPNPLLDEITNISARVSLGSLLDFKQVKISNSGTFTIPFTPPSPVIVRGSTFIPAPDFNNDAPIDSNDDIIRDTIFATRVAGFYGVLVKITAFNSSAVRLWKNQPHNRGSYGYISLNKGETPVANHAITYTEQYLIADGIIQNLQQFNEEFLIAAKEGRVLDDWCPDGAYIRLNPSVSAAVGFIPVYETWRVDLTHNHYHYSALAFAAGFAVVGATLAVTGLTAGFLGAAEILAAGLVSAEVPVAAVGGSAAVAALGASEAVVVEVPLAFGVAELSAIGAL